MHFNSSNVVFAPSQKTVSHTSSFTDAIEKNKHKNIVVNEVTGDDLLICSLNNNQFKRLLDAGESFLVDCTKKEDPSYSLIRPSPNLLLFGSLDQLVTEFRIISDYME